MEFDFYAFNQNELNELAFVFAKKLATEAGSKECEFLADFFKQVSFNLSEIEIEKFLQGNFDIV